MSNEFKYQSFVEIVEQVVRKNRTKKRTVQMTNMLGGDLDRDFLIENIRKKTRSNTKQYNNMKLSSNRSLFTGGVGKSILKKVDSKGEGGGVPSSNKFSTMKNLIVVETLIDNNNLDNFNNVTVKAIEREENVNITNSKRVVTFSDEVDMNTTRRLITESSTTLDTESPVKVLQRDRLKRVNTHPSLGYLKKIISFESKPTDHVQVMNLNNKLKIYEFLTSLFTFMCK
jgi:hypothetical protein